MNLSIHKYNGTIVIQDVLGIEIKFSGKEGIFRALPLAGNIFASAECT